MGILRTLMFALTSVIYGVIPSVYNIFEKLATAEFFTQQDIKDFSNNIYILVSVIMLFAFGIRLLSTIVDPSKFDDKKVGVKKTFLNGFLSVFLIAIIPLAFSTAYSFQNKVLKGNFLPKLFFGIEIPEGQSLGQIIAGQTFKAFCYPTVYEKDNDFCFDEKGCVDEELASPYDRVVYDDISKSDSLQKYVKREYDDEYILTFNIILSPLLGIFIVYQLVLMCIDIALRSLKLTLLQLFAPLVLCANIFSGGDILKKWFKEVASTYVLLFIKVITLIFIIIGFSYVDSFLDRMSLLNSSGGILARGLAKAAIIIGLLTLIKQLPNIINSIFGTNIKEDSGIGGRLAGMAAVGGLAKNAWDKIKTTASHAGLKALEAGAIGAAALTHPFATAGLMSAGGLGLHGWNKGFGKEKPWKDRAFGTAVKATKAFVGGKGLISGTAAAGKVITESEGYKERQAIKAQKKATGRWEDIRESIEAEAAKYGVKDGITEQGIITKGLEMQKAFNNSVNNSNLSKQLKEAVIKKNEEGRKLDLYNNIKDKKTAFMNALDDSLNKLNKNDKDYQTKLDKINALKNSIDNKGIASVEEVGKQIDDLFNSGIISDYDANKMGTALQRIGNTIDNAIKSGEFGEKDFYTSDGKLNLSAGNIAANVSRQNLVVESAKSKFEELKNNATSLDKEMMTTYDSFGNQINEQSKYNMENKGIYEDTYNRHKLENIPVPESVDPYRGDDPDNYDSEIENYSNSGYNQNDEGEFFNPYTDEYDKDYDPHSDALYNDIIARGQEAANYQRRVINEGAQSEKNRLSEENSNTNSNSGDEERLESINEQYADILNRIKNQNNNNNNDSNNGNN